MIHDENHKKRSLLFWSFISILFIFVVFFCMRNYFTNNYEINAVDGSGDVSETSSQGEPSSINDGIIPLSKVEESAEFEHLQLSFKGIQEEGNDYYSYTLKLFYDGDEIQQELFSDTNHYHIWSGVYGMFRVQKIDQVYIIQSFDGAQCLGNYVLFINEEHEILNSFSNVSLKLKDHNIEITESDLGSCCPMGDDNCIKQHMRDSSYVISGLSMIPTE